MPVNVAPADPARIAGHPRNGSGLKNKLSRGGSRVWLLILFWVYGAITAQEFFPILLTAPLFALILWQVAKITDEQFVSLDMFWFCALIFFVVGPCQAIGEMGFNNYGLNKVTYELKDFLIAELIVFLFFLSFGLFLKFARNTAAGRTAPQKNIELQIWNTPILLTVAVVSFIGYTFYSGGIENVFATRRDKIFEQISFIAYIFLGMICTSTVLLAVLAADKRRSSVQRWVIGLQFFASTGILFVAVNPFNSFRFNIIGSWFPVFLTFFAGRVRYRIAYGFLLLGVIVLMPLLSLTTRHGLGGVETYEDTGYSLNVTQIKDVDVFDTLVHSVGIVEQQGHTLGRNTLAIMFFYVPRAIWIDKPVVGGLLVGEDLLKNYASTGTANLSFFVGGDLYMDFGYAGVIFGALLIASAWVLYSRHMATFCGVDVASAMLIGSIPIMLRGPVGAVIGFFVCLLFAQLFYRIIFVSTAAAVLRRGHS